MFVLLARWGRRFCSRAADFISGAHSSVTVEVRSLFAVASTYVALDRKRGLRSATGPRAMSCDQCCAVGIRSFQHRRNMASSSLLGYGDSARASLLHKEVSLQDMVGVGMLLHCKRQIPLKARVVHCQLSCCNLFQFLTSCTGAKHAAA